MHRLEYLGSYKQPRKFGSGRKDEGGDHGVYLVQTWTGLSGRRAWFPPRGVLLLVPRQDLHMVKGGL